MFIFVHFINSGFTVQASIQILFRSGSFKKFFTSSPSPSLPLYALSPLPLAL